MSIITTRPSATDFLGDWVRTGGTSAHGVLSDNSDATYMQSAGLLSMEQDYPLPTIPAGGLVVAIVARARTRKVNGDKVRVRFLLNPDNFKDRYGNVVDELLVITWAAVTTTNLFVGYIDSLPAASASEMNVDKESGDADARVFETYFDWHYNAKPVVNVLKPVTPITTDTTPAVSWEHTTLDTTGGVQTHFRAKVFTDAQYLDANFDPETSTAFEDSGVIIQDSLEWEPSTAQLDDTYRAYVKIAQTLYPSGRVHWSDWDFIEYTVTINRPAVPTITAAAESGQGRNKLTLGVAAGPASTDALQVERSLDSSTWSPLRTKEDSGRVPLPYVMAIGTFSDTADATSHAPNLPVPPGGIQSGDLLLAVSSFDSNTTVAWPSDWTEIKDETGNALAVSVACAYKRATGNESGTITVTTSTAQGGAVQILCIRNAHKTTAPEVSTGVSAATANADPDSLNPAGWATEHTLWIAAMGNDGDVAVTAGPSGYYGFLNTRWANVAGAGVATASKLLSAASEDPGAFTHAAEDTRAFTIAVRGATPDPIVYDYEAPNGRPAYYRARSIHDYSADPAGVFSSIAASAWTTVVNAAWQGNDVWVKHPSKPGLNLIVEVYSQPSYERVTRQGVFQPLGRSSVIVVSDKRGPPQGTMTFSLDGGVDRDAWDSLLNEVDPLLVQMPIKYKWDERWVLFGDHHRERYVDMLEVDDTLDTLPWIEVPRPAGNLE